MKSFLTLLLVFNMTIKLASCQTEPLVVVFENSEPDHATDLTENKIYILKKLAKNADFNYNKLNSLDNQLKHGINTKSLMPIFTPIPGKFNYYQFLATFKNQGYNGGEPSVIKDFHDILIIKTDEKNNIIDAYHYTLEWAEVPLQYDLFKFSARNIILNNNLNINQLKLKRTYSWDEKDIVLKDNGVIKLK